MTDTVVACESHVNVNDRSCCPRTSKHVIREETSLHNGGEVILGKLRL